MSKLKRPLKFSKRLSEHFSTRHVFEPLNCSLFGPLAQINISITVQDPKSENVCRRLKTSNSSKSSFGGPNVRFWAKVSWGEQIVRKCLSTPGVESIIQSTVSCFDVQMHPVAKSCTLSCPP